jgi:hypothetical protein
MMAKNKRVQFSTEECVRLTSCYLTISEDSIVGVGQKSETFWNGITQKFTSAGGSEATSRTARSLSSKWNEISRACKKFTGYYNAQERLNESGTTEEDMMDKALLEYKAREGSLTKNNQTYVPKEFVFVECWKVLKEHPRWASMCCDSSPTGLPEKNKARPEGRGAAKYTRKAEQEKHKVADVILAGMKRKADAMEDANFMFLLADATCPEADRIRGMALLRAKMFRRHEELHGSSSAGAFSSVSSSSSEARACSISSEARPRSSSSEARPSNSLGGARVVGLRAPTLA